MKIKLLLLLLVPYGSIFCHVKHIFFEIDNVLFSINEMESLKSFPGLGSFSQKLARRYSEQFLDLLEDNHKFDTLKNANVLFRNKPIPSLLCAYFLDKVSSEHAMDLATKTIHNQISWFNTDRIPLNIATQSVFDPAKAASYLTPIKEMHAFVKKLSKNPDNKLYIFSNKNPKTFKQLKSKYPEFFSYFNGGFIISGKTKILKPHSDIYNYIFNNYQIYAKQAYFIESQAEYLKPLKHFPESHTFLWENGKSISGIEKFLK